MALEEQTKLVEEINQAIEAQVSKPGEVIDSKPIVDDVKSKIAPLPKEIVDP